MVPSELFGEPMAYGADNFVYIDMTRITIGTQE